MQEDMLAQWGQSPFVQGLLEDHRVSRERSRGMVNGEKTKRLYELAGL